MKVEFTNDFILFQADEKIARRLDAKYLKSKKAYRLPNTIGALKELHNNGYNVQEYGSHKATARKKFLELKNLDTDKVLHLEGLDVRLRPYQRVDIHYLTQLPHCAIFNEQRTGKTPTSLQIIQHEQPEHVIVCCPASVVLQFSKEVDTWTEYVPVPYNGTPKRREKALEFFKSRKKSILVSSPQTLKQDVEKLSSLKDFHFIVDEAHFLRNYQTKQSKIIYQIGKHAKKRIALTGTPSVNNGADIYGILKFLYPAKFSSYWDFVDRYFRTWDPPWGGKEIGEYKRKEELQEILDLISVQRKRSEVMKWLPPKQYQTINLEMDKKQRKHYEEMLKDFMTEDIETIGVLDQLIRLRQICLAPSILDIEAPSVKEKFLMEWLKDNPTESVIVFSNFSSYLKKLHKEVEGSGLIIGEVSKPQRLRVQESFQTGKTKVIFANIQAAGTGLTLDQGSTIIFLDRHFSPSQNEQAEDRIVATTKESNQSSLIIDLVCEKSIDERIHQILTEKGDVTKVINNYKNIGELISS
jgi:SNF2 family DNA or RNA helicase